MINQLPPELFAQRPVRSSFQSSKGASSVTKRRVILFGSIAVILLASIILADNLISKQEQPVAMIPHIAATGEIKERPEQPGGIDIPHRDVAVFDQLDNTTDVAQEEKVEQLLPQAEEPVIEMEAVGEEVIASMESVVTESLEAELNKAAASMSPAVTKAVMDGRTENLLGIDEEPQALPAPPPVQRSVVKEVKKSNQQVVTVLVEQPVQEKIKLAVKKAEETMKVDAPKVVIPKVVTPKIEKKVIAKKVVKKAIKKAAQVKATSTPHLPADLFTKGKTKINVSGKMRRTQLGSFRSADIARKASEVMTRKYSTSLRGKQLEVVRANLGAKGIYYRVMSHRMPEQQAKALCTTVKAANSGCFLVK